MLPVRKLTRFMGLASSLEIEYGASSAIAMSARRGFGRLRDSEFKWLWLQQLVGSEGSRS